jgi:hypothetical protein
MSKPSDTDLNAIEISNVPDLVLRRIIQDARDQGKADPVLNALAVLAHAILALRRDMKKK